jgi:large subunit ribosomal protein L16
MKFRKYFRIRYEESTALRGSLRSGLFGLKILQKFNLTNEQLTATVRSVKRIIRRKNFLIINTLPFWSVTRKPRDVRMGRGKGNPVLKVYPLKAGTIIFETRGGVPDDLIIRAFHFCSLRLPVFTRIVKKYDKRTDSIKGC